jgi:uncharacterized protein (UPF0332 family)
VKAHVKALVRYRIEQAEESLESAQLLLDNGKPRSSVNRSYYAMFYAVLALLAARGSETSKHSGVIALFDQEYVKTGIFDKDLSRWLHDAFDFRQRADYREMFHISHDQAKLVIEHAASFLSAVRSHLTKMISSEE